MAVMASWNGKTWGVSSQRIAALNGVSSGFIPAFIRVEIGFGFLRIKR